MIGYALMKISMLVGIADRRITGEVAKLQAFIHILYCYGTE